MFLHTFFIHRWKGSLLLLSWLPIILPLLITGWGWWGHGAIGDYSGDFTDAMRRFYGEIPYRDFIPIYGAFMVHLAAPLFLLGTHAFCTIWLLTACLILIHARMLVFLLRDLGGWVVRWLIGAFFLLACAFKTGNAKFILGFSTSGFVSSILWTAILILLQNQQRNYRIKNSRFQPLWFVGSALAFQMFTKMDAGLLAFIIFLFLIFTSLFTKPNNVLFIMSGFTVIAITVWLLLILQGGVLELLWKSMIHGLYIAPVFSDNVLKRQFILLFITLGCVRLMLRTFLKKISPIFRLVWAIFLVYAFPIAIVGDFFREIFVNPLKAGVLLNFLQCIIMMNSIYSLVFLFLRRRTFKVIWNSRILWINLAMMIGAGAIARIATTGWYPMNYYQPAFFIVTVLAIRWGFKHLSSVAIFKFITTPIMLCPMFSIALLLLGWDSYKTGKIDTHVVLFHSPWGKCWIPAYHAVEIFEPLARRPPYEGLFTPQLPGLYLITGLKPASFLTLQENITWAGPYKEQWEQHSLDLFKQRVPKYIFIPYKPVIVPFGKDFGEPIFREIHEHYRLEIINLARGELWVKNDPSSPAEKRHVY